MDGKEDDKLGPGGNNRKSSRARVPVDKFQPGMEDKDRGATKKKKDKEKGNREVTKESGNQKQAAVEPTEEDKSYVLMILTLHIERRLLRHARDLIFASTFRIFLSVCSPNDDAGLLVF